jgi:flagellar FliL protein
MADEEEEKPKSRTGLKIALIVLSVFLLVGGTVAGMYFAGVFGENPQVDAGEDGEEQVEAKGPAIYVPFDPAFVVNFSKPGKAKFLQITMQALTRSPEVPALIQTHMPAIRNNLVLLFSSQSFEKVSTAEGKEELRAEALATIQEVLDAESEGAKVESVYFTSIVMQ